MSYNPDHAIAAVASAPGGAGRGVIRISGPDVLSPLTRCFHPSEEAGSLAAIRGPQRIAGAIRVDGDAGHPDLDIPGHLLFWPTTQSYTRQPSAEFHTLGSPPLLAAIIEQLARAGVRSAEPGEFTLRAFLAGRIDLTQAEAVLGVIDARDRSDLDAALDQLAGGLSRPLHRLREDLLGVLAELEAGLDFVEEDIEFISRDALQTRLTEAGKIVEATLAQLAARDTRTELPRVTIVGPPNAGKSSLFNALVERYGAAPSAGAIVSPEPGATRDYLVARIELEDAACEIVDTAGDTEMVRDVVRDGIHDRAQQAAADQRRHADVRLCCFDATSSDWGTTACEGDLLVLTKADLTTSSPASASAIRCSSVTGEGLDDLAQQLGRLVDGLHHDHARAAVAAATSTRCAGSLREAMRALQAAVALTDQASDELVAAEIRTALDALGEVVGAICADDVLDRVFSQFCIGK